ncbi:permease, partial [Mesorhizobium sp. M7A.F.Ca.CA.004.11.2.1]
MPAVPSILGFGAIAIDDIVYVDQPLSAGKGKVLQSARAFGGNVATALAAVARLGGSAGFV